MNIALGLSETTGLTAISLAKNGVKK
jgi:hypothetical protein